MQFNPADGGGRTSRATPRIVKLFALSVAIVSTAGCTNVRVHSADAVIPTGRVVWAAIPPGESSENRAMVPSGLVAEFELGYTQANDNQPVRAGDDPEIDGTEFVGPTELRTRVQLVDSALTVRGGVILGEVFRIEPIAGAEVVTAELQVAGGGLQATKRSLYVGPLLGLRAGVQLHERFELYGLVRAAGLFSIYSDASGSTAGSVRGEVGGRARLLEHLGLFGGYRWIDLDDEGGGTDVTYELRGPVFGAELLF